MHTPMIIRLEFDTKQADTIGLEPVTERLRSKPGEVVMVLRTPDDRIWLHTKSFYPEGILRLPTGGLKNGENPNDGLLRELHEESGMVLETAPPPVAVLRYRIGETVYPFESHIYVVAFSDNEPQPVDESEDITDWIAADEQQFRNHTERIASLTGDWHAWGGFRAAAHREVTQHLFT